MPDLPLGAVVAFEFEKWNADEEIALVHDAGAGLVQVYRNYPKGVTAEHIRGVLDGAGLVADSLHAYIDIEMFDGPPFDLSAEDASARNDALDIARREADYARTLGCRDIVVHPVGPGDTRDDAFRPDNLAASAERLARIAEAADVSPKDVQAYVLGGHGDTMVPLVRHSQIGGVPLADRLSAEQIEGIVERTRGGGAEIVSLLKTGSAFYAPAAAAVTMAQSILRDERRVLPSAAYCDAEYGVGGYFVGVPARLGAGGVMEVLEFDLNADERAAFNSSVAHVTALVEKLAELGY